MNNNRVHHVILCSGVTLGVYVPALILARNSKKSGIATQVHVLEHFFTAEKQRQLLKMKEQFHNDFKFALMAQKMPSRISESVKEQEIAVLIKQWKKQGTTILTLFSGYWLSVLQPFFDHENGFEQIKINTCFMDANLSTSWNHLKRGHLIYHPFKLFDLEKRRVNYQLSPVLEDSDRLIDYENRDQRYLIHGGGWGIGNYHEKIQQMSDYGNIKLDIICYQHQEYETEHNGWQYYLLPPEWLAWQSTEPEFPPLYNIHQGKIGYPVISEYSASYELIRRAKAVISKPGGGTLLDSFIAETPLIILDKTFGNYEKDNARLWLELGFAITYEDWKDSGFESKILSPLHQNIQSYKTCANIPNLLSSLIPAKESENNK